MTRRQNLNFSLYQIDWYPGLTEGGSTAVAGEVWEINPEEWDKLDEYEGVPEDYLRKTIPLRMECRFKPTFI